MRSIMDSIGSRLDEARDTGRYLVGLLVFLGLLGTFWGLLETIQSVGQAHRRARHQGRRQRHGVRRAEGRPRRAAARAWARRSRPRCWASPARWSWASSSCRRATPTTASTTSSRNGCRASPSWRPAARTASDHASRQLYERHPRHAARRRRPRRAACGSACRRRAAAAPPADEAVRELAKGVDQLVRQMRAEQKVVREWVDEQAAQQSEVATVLKDLAANMRAQGLAHGVRTLAPARAATTACSGRATSTCCRRCCSSSPS